MDNIKEFAEDMMKNMKSIIESGREATPMLFRVSMDDNIDIIAIPMDEDSKDEVSFLLKALASQPTTAYVLFLCDAWTAETKSKEEYEQLKEQYGEVRLVPGRREAVTCSLLSKGMSGMYACWKYNRDKGNKPIFDEKLHWVEGKTSGRFAPDLSGRAS